MHGTVQTTIGAKTTHVERTQLALQLLAMPWVPPLVTAMDYMDVQERQQEMYQHWTGDNDELLLAHNRTSTKTALLFLFRNRWTVCPILCWYRYRYHECVRCRCRTEDSTTRSYKLQGWWCTIIIELPLQHSNTLVNISFTSSIGTSCTFVQCYDATMLHVRCYDLRCYSVTCTLLTK